MRSLVFGNINKLILIILFSFFLEINYCYGVPDGNPKNVQQIISDSGILETELKAAELLPMIQNFIDMYNLKRKRFLELTQMAGWTYRDSGNWSIPEGSAFIKYSLIPLVREVASKQEFDRYKFAGDSFICIGDFWSIKYTRFLQKLKEEYRKYLQNQIRIQNQNKIISQQNDQIKFLIELVQNAQSQLKQIQTSAQ